MSKSLYNKNYHQKNKEKHNKTCKEYYKEHRETEIERSSKYIKEHKESHAKACKKYYEKNKEQIQKYQFEWRQSQLVKNNIHYPQEENSNKNAL